MAGKCLVILALVLSTSSVAAKDLALLSGGHRVIDRDPASAHSNCSAWAFAPSPLVDEGGGVAAMYTTGDAFSNHCKGNIHDDNRFGDRIRLHPRHEDGTWSGGFDVIDRHSFAWMRDEAFLERNPDSFVGHLASPSVIRAHGRFYMAFVASVNDRNLCAGEHYSGNICGSCFDPWSYFVVMWAVSDDGVTWRVKERSRGDAALLGRPPGEDDVSLTSMYKGLTRVSVLEHEGHFYLGTQFWTRDAIKMLMFRIERDPSSEWGIAEDAEVWSAQRRTWVDAPAGRVPDSFADSPETSVFLSSAFSSMARTSIFGRDGFIALTTPADARRIVFLFSTNLVDWTFDELVPSAIPHLGDGRSYAASLIDPVAVDDNGRLKLYFASADGDLAHGIDRDGAHDCFLDPNMGPTAPYVGTGIYEAVLELVDPRPTRTSLALPRETLVAGESVRVTVTVTSEDGSVPLGRVVVVDSHGTWREAVLVNGRAHVDLPTRGNLYAYYVSDGIWLSSSSEVVPVTVVTRGKRRAANAR